MCGCEPGFTCSMCAGTPQDPVWWEEPDRDDERATVERDLELAWAAWFGAVGRG